VTNPVRIQRECESCGKSYRGAHRKCRTCRTVLRECVNCGRSFRGDETRCRHCATVIRQCPSCGVDYSDRASECRTCRQIPRECASCGRAFRGKATQCGRCYSAVVRECVSCGQRYAGSHAKCYRCRASDRTCATCGDLFRGRTRRCGRCSGRGRECDACGQIFNGHSALCARCVWANMTPAERSAQARTKNARRRVRQLAASGPLPAATYRQIMAPGICVYCGDLATTIDHVIPLVLGGTEARNNLVPACFPCNRDKSAHLITDWRPDRVAHAVEHSPVVAAIYMALLDERHGRKRGGAQ
jgi:5-methylcytosine-specific restriction endonuclease McrA